MDEAGGVKSNAARLLGMENYQTLDAQLKRLEVHGQGDSAKGRTQAKLYADGLEKEHGQRPVIFYTNGYDLWIWNDAAGQPWRKLYGFYSKDSLQHLIFQRTEKKPVSEVSPDPHIAGRM